MKKHRYIAGVCGIFLLGAVFVTGCGEKATEKDIESVKETVTVAEATLETVTETVQESIKESEMVIEKTDIAALREQMKEQGDICGIGNIGFYEANGDNLNDYLREEGVFEQYTFLENVMGGWFLDAGGSEVYFILPADESYSVSIYEWIIDESNNYEGAIGNELYSSDAGDPVIFTCNVSDIMPNTRVVVQNADEKLEYTPCMSLENGRLQLPESGLGVMDLSMYRGLEIK